MNDNEIKAYNEGFKKGFDRGCENQKLVFHAAVCELAAKIEELTNKHWQECWQIALYDDELRQVKNNAE